MCVFLAEKMVISAQMKEHRGAVLDLIEVYLKGTDREQIIFLVFMAAHDLGALLPPTVYLNIFASPTSASSFL